MKFKEYIRPLSTAICHCYLRTHQWCWSSTLHYRRDLQELDQFYIDVVSSKNLVCSSSQAVSFSRIIAVSSSSLGSFSATKEASAHPHFGPLSQGGEDSEGQLGSTEYEECFLLLTGDFSEFLEREKLQVYPLSTKERLPRIEELNFSLALVSSSALNVR